MMATNLYHTPVHAFLKAHTSAQIEELFALAELEEEAREMQRALHATD